MNANGCGLSVRDQSKNLYRKHCSVTFSTPPTTLQRHNWKFETNIPRKGIALHESQFPHLRVCEWFLYSHDWSAYSATGKYPGNILYINRSQTHECGNWDWGRAIPFLGIQHLFRIFNIMSLKCSQWGGEGYGTLVAREVLWIHKWDFRCSVDSEVRKWKTLYDTGRKETLDLTPDFMGSLRP